MSDNTNIHAGHRKRLKERYRNEGLENFNEINVLELLLFYCVQQKDTNPLAHRLIDEFQSISNILNASPEELMQVPGVTEHIAVFLSLVKSVNRFAQVRESDKIKTLNTIEACVEYVRPRVAELPVEVLYLVCLNAKCKPIFCKRISSGNSSEVAFAPPLILETAIKVKASTVLLVHNHPGGKLAPSWNDIYLTSVMQEQLRLVNMQLIDHLIIGQDDYVSICSSCKKELEECKKKRVQLT